MADDPTGDRDLIARLRAYEAASNANDIDGALAQFTDDGCIEFGSHRACGAAALRAAHEYDLASHTHIALGDFAIAGGSVTCEIVYCDELDRAVGLDGLYSRAEFTFRGGRIQTFKALPPDETERERHRRAESRFHVWARQHYPDEVSKGFHFDYESGASLYRVVRAWQDAQASSSSPE